MARAKFITKTAFNKLKVDDKVKVLYMTGNAHIVQKNEPTVNVMFSSGPWEGKTFEITRKQIASGHIFPLNERIE